MLAPWDHSEIRVNFPVSKMPCLNLRATGYAVLQRQLYNPRNLARNLLNRLWYHMTNRGHTEPRCAFFSTLKAICIAFQLIIKKDEMLLCVRTFFSCNCDLLSYFPPYIRRHLVSIYHLFLEHTAPTHICSFSPLNPNNGDDENKN